MTRMFVSDLPTPCILVEGCRVSYNIQRMQNLANAESVRLRPHVKTHKCVRLAKQQLDAGAIGITVAKPSEALVFARAGVSDIRIAYTLAARHHFETVAELARQVNVSFCVDTIEAAQAASDYLTEHGHTVDVLIEIDSEYGRCGIRWDNPDLPEFANAVSTLRGLRLRGILSHAGQSYKGISAQGQSVEASVRSAAETERSSMLSAANRLRAAGVAGVVPGEFEVSIGSTPSMAHFRNQTDGGFTITEIRPGNYIFHDASQVALQTAGMADCALTVMATVVSKHRDPNSQERLYLDAGRKILTTDTGFGTTGYGILLHSPKTMQPLPHVRITGLSEEHAWISIHGGSTLEVGDRIRILPNHACTVVNTQDNLYLVDGESVVEKLSVDARGMST